MRLENPAFESQKGQNIFPLTQTKLAALTAETSVQWVTEVKQLKSETDRSALFSDKVNEWS